MSAGKRRRVTPRSGATDTPPTRSQLQRLAREARLARRRAYVPYSRFKVGAALLTRDGDVIPGCNVENASYPLTCCAERTAAFKAVAEGKRNLVAIAVVADSPQPTPCGACRQVLWELGGNLWVLLLDVKGHSQLVRMADLLPMPFDSRNL